MLAERIAACRSESHGQMIWARASGQSDAVEHMLVMMVRREATRLDGLEGTKRGDG